MLFSFFINNSNQNTVWRYYLYCKNKQIKEIYYYLVSIKMFYYMYFISFTNKCEFNLILQQ